MGKQPHLSTFKICCHNVVPKVAKPRSKNALTKYTSTALFVIVYQIHDILGKCFKKKERKENNAGQKDESAHFMFIPLKASRS